VDAPLFPIDPAAFDAATANETPIPRNSSREALQHSPNGPQEESETDVKNSLHHFGNRFYS
jgi:hypothetical protein